MGHFRPTCRILAFVAAIFISSGLQLPQSKPETTREPTSNETAELIDMVHHVQSGKYNRNISSAWSAYQEQLLDMLRGTPPEPPGRPLRILVVSAVSDSVHVRANFEDSFQRLKGNAAGDQFSFALFHYDSNVSGWEKKAWYASETGPVVLRHKGLGCKPHFWMDITGDMAREYDYVWLLDEDMRLDLFSWDIYRTILARWRPLVSQPSIVQGSGPGMSTSRGPLATRVSDLIMKATRSNIYVAYETPRSEVQAPFVSSQIWDIVHERISGNDLHSDWQIDEFWDAVSLISKIQCGRNSSLVVNVSPVRHMNYRSLKGRGAKMRCKLNNGQDNANCRGVTSVEAAHVREALAGYCEVPDAAQVEKQLNHLVSAALKKEKKWEPDCPILEARWNLFAEADTARKWIVPIQRAK